MLDALLLEAKGIPTVTIIQDRFEFAAKLHAENGGLADLPMLIEPSPDVGNIPFQPKQLARDNLSLVVRGLTEPPDRSGRGEDPEETQ